MEVVGSNFMERIPNALTLMFDVCGVCCVQMLRMRRGCRTGETWTLPSFLMAKWQLGHLSLPIYYVIS